MPVCNVVHPSANKRRDLRWKFNTFWKKCNFTNMKQWCGRNLILFKGVEYFVWCSFQQNAFPKLNFSGTEKPIHTQLQVIIFCRCYPENQTNRRQWILGWLNKSTISYTDLASILEKKSQTSYFFIRIRTSFKILFHTDPSIPKWEGTQNGQEFFSHTAEEKCGINSQKWNMR